MKVIVACVTLLFACIVSGKPFINFEDFFVDVTDCYGVTCPQDSAACIKNTTTTDDLKTLRIHTVCQDANGRELASDLREEPNTNEGVSVHSFAFKGSYTSSKGNDVNYTFAPRNSDKTGFDQVETFD